MEQEGQKPAWFDKQRYFDEFGRRLPTPEQYEKYEKLIEGFVSRGEPNKMEDFARDPQNPTQAELLGLRAADLEDGVVAPTFEEYFGFPDPREAPTAEEIASPEELEAYAQYVRDFVPRSASTWSGSCCARPARRTTTRTSPSP